MERRVRLALLACVLAPLASLGTGVAKTGAQAGERTSDQHACVFNHEYLWTPAGICRPQARSYPTALHGWVSKAIYDGAVTFGVPYKVLEALGRCESNLNPKANNGSHFGLFQFDRSTFKQAIGLMRHDTGISARTVWNPLDSAYAAGYLFATGHAPAWTCEAAIG